MRHFKFAVWACAVVLLSGTAARAQFNGLSFYNVNPWTQAPGGIVGNTLVLTDTLTGFNIAGQVTVNVPAGNSAGILLAWEVYRSLDPSYPAQPMTNTATLTGFVNAPLGNGTAAGSLTTDFISTAGSAAVAPITHSGPGITIFNVTQNTNFFYSPVAGNFMRQSFFVDYNFNFAIGGNYIVDFPAESETQPAPEPVCMSALGLCAVMLLRRR